MQRDAFVRSGGIVAADHSGDTIHRTTRHPIGRLHNRASAGAPPRATGQGDGTATPWWRMAR